MAKKLKTLIREVNDLQNYLQKRLPVEVSRAWLWTSQNAFLTETDPQTGKRWPERHGVAYGKGFTKKGNIEQFLTYKKLHRTGRLLRGLKVRVIRKGRNTAIQLYNNVKYASDHETGQVSQHRKIKSPYVHNGASVVILGGRITPRHSMRPSRKVLFSARRLLINRITTRYGWTSNK